MKLQLPTITLFCADCVNINRAVNVLERCKSLCDFGDVKLLTSLPTDYEHKIEITPLNSLIAYSIFMLTKAYQYVTTEHCLVVQRDGFILNTSAWNENWLKLDWISPIFEQYPKVGSGGFSLRSKKLMKNVADNMPKWDGSQEQADEIQQGLTYYEDGEICLSGKFSHFKFATLEQAAIFSQGGNRDPKYYREYPFGFHGAWQAIDHKTGRVSPVCEHKTLNCNCTHDHKTFLKSLAE